MFVDVVFSDVCFGYRLDYSVECVFVEYHLFMWGVHGGNESVLLGVCLNAEEGVMVL